MKFRLFPLFALLALAAPGVQADAPEGYYDRCLGLASGELKTSLHDLISPHTAISYGNPSWEAFAITDASPEGYWMDIYTHEEVAVSGHSGMNIEHTFPKSWWGGANNNAYRDITHLMPVDQWANNDRSNHPFGEVQTEKAPNFRCPSPNYKLGSPKAGQGGGATYVFEPADEYKGDMARTYFYMVTCYQELTWSADGLRTCMQGAYPTLQPWAVEMLLRWHRQDPVSPKEIARNEGVYSIQHNRNPFIDHPELAEYIWGEQAGQPWGEGETPPTPPQPPVIPPVDEAELFTPLPGDRYDFAVETGGLTHTLAIPVSGQGFASPLIAKISGDDADCFRIVAGTASLGAISLAAADVNASGGVTLQMRYSPLEPTEADSPHHATLTLTGTDLEEPVEVTLSGTCPASSVESIELNDKQAQYFTPDGRSLGGVPSAPGLYIVVTGGCTRKIILR